MAAGVTLREEIRQRIVELRSQGLSQDAIAAQLGVGQSSVSRALAKAGFSQEGPGRRPASGHRCIRRRGSRWHVVVDHQHIGTFGSLEEAIACRARCGR
jgi:IS30 family transposase